MKATTKSRQAQKIRFLLIAYLAEVEADYKDIETLSTFEEIEEAAEDILEWCLELGTLQNAIEVCENYLIEKDEAVAIYHIVCGRGKIVATR